MICELCLCEITEDEIQLNLVFDFVHPCGKRGWYHGACVLPVVENK